MDYKYSCVIDSTGAYKTLVLVLPMPDESGQVKETIQYYILQEGESLVDATPPTGYVKPVWNGTMWVESATAEEIAAVDTRTIPEILAVKIAALSTACNAAIIAGADIALSDGKVQHFDYGTEDQLNISEMFSAIAMGATCYPYQPTNGSCTVYKAADIVTIYITLASQKTAQLTYYHALKDYVQTLSTVAEIDAVTYGQPLTGVYLTHYNATVATASEQMQAIIARVGGAL